MTQMLFIQRLLQFLLHTLFPESPIAQHIRDCSVADFIKTAQTRHNDTIFTSPKTLSPFIFRDSFVRTAIHLAKYRNEPRICHILGETLWDFYGEDLSSNVLINNARWIVVPIPLTKRKRRMRGYNQSEEIAIGFLRHADKSHFSLATDVLLRTEARESQTKQVTRLERTSNVAGTFVVKNNSKILENNILIIDDVVTTGATLREATRALRKAGARRILCITVAH